MAGCEDKIMIGVDVSKRWIDLALPDGTVRRVDNDEAAISGTFEAVGGERIALVAFEPTGGYERALVHALRGLGLPHTRIHPDKLVAFRRQKGIKAKTDAMDARLVLSFAEQEYRDGARGLPASDELLVELVTRREQILAAVQAERCRLEHAHTPLVRAQIERTLARLGEDQAEIEAALDDHVAADARLARQARLMQSVKGIGPVSTWTIMARLPQLGLATGKQIASLIGLAPRDRQSGRRTGRATTGHGDATIRKVLFNAARSAIVHNPVLKAFYRRLVDENRRPKPVALVAVMRKLAVILNAIVRDQTEWKRADLSLD